MNNIECINVRHGLFFDKVRLRALDNDYVIYDSLMGERKFFMNKKAHITTKIPKRYMAFIGEKHPLKYWITVGIFGGNAFDFKWKWL
jgi:hypothetical protein